MDGLKSEYCKIFNSKTSLKVIKKIINYKIRIYYRNVIQQLCAVFSNHIRSFLKNYITNYAVFSI